MEALIKFDKQELIKSIHANNEMISLTDLWKQSGEDAQRTPAKWQESEPVQRFIQTASKILNIGISDIIKSKRGKGGGTYAHKQIALEYAQYLDPKLAILVNEIFFERIEEEKNPDLIVDRAIKTYQKKGKDQKWIASRIDSKIKRNFFTACLAEHGVTKDGYRNCTNAVYNNLFGGTSAVVREKKGLSPKDNIRDNLSQVELAAIALSEALAMENIETKNVRGNARCELETNYATKSVARAILENRNQQKKA